MKFVELGWQNKNNFCIDRNRLTVVKFYATILPLSKEL